MGGSPLGAKRNKTKSNLFLRPKSIYVSVCGAAFSCILVYDLVFWAGVLELLRRDVACNLVCGASPDDLSGSWACTAAKHHRKSGPNRSGVGEGGWGHGAGGDETGLVVHEGGL